MAAVPQPILDYLDAIRRFDGNALLAAFAPDAVIVDERVVYRGLREISGWIEDAIVVARPVLTLRLSAPVGAGQRDRSTSAGRTWPGRCWPPWSFTILDDHVSRLEIRRRELDPQASSKKSRAGLLP